MTGNMTPLPGRTPDNCIARTVPRSTWPGSGAEVSWLHATWTVGRYPTHALTMSPVHTTHSGTADTDNPRRHHCTPRHPTTTSPTATPAAPIHNHNSRGAGSPAIPNLAKNQWAQSVTTTPPAKIPGKTSTRQRRVRHPIAPTSTSAEVSCTRTGNQP